MFILSCKKTSTPNEYLNLNDIEQTEYNKDRNSLTNLTKLMRDSIRASSATPEGKTLEIYIDTIFYNPDNKIVFIVCP